ncbi:MAG: hypothetical protein ACRDIU_02345 [Actinomycetota bacterium]
MALSGEMDVAVIMSADEDLAETTSQVHAWTNRKVKVEAAVFNENSQPIVLPHYNYTHQLRKKDFDVAQDTFNYRDAMEERWHDAFLGACRARAPNLRPRQDP